MNVDPSAQQNAEISKMYVEFAPMVYRMALKACRNDHHEAVEVVHETFMRVVEQFDRTFAGVPPEGTLKLLFTIARRRIIDRFRKLGKVSPTADLEVLNLGPRPRSSDPLMRMIDRESSAELWSVLRDWLTQMEHAVALMSWDWDLPDDAIARALGISSGTVRTHRSRAKAKIDEHTGGGLRFPDEPDNTSTSYRKGERA